MDILTNKTYESYNYLNRYTSVPYYYNIVDEREVYGIGSQMVKEDISYTSHRVTTEDTLDSLALKYYNNPTYWWVIAYFNDIQDSFIWLYGSYGTLKIPSISSVAFGDPR